MSSIPDVQKEQTGLGLFVSATFFGKQYSETEYWTVVDMEFGDRNPFFAEAINWLDSACRLVSFCPILLTHCKDRITVA